MTKLNEAENAASKPIEKLPQRTFGPFSLAIVIPWLLLAAVIRIPGFAYTGNRLNMFFFISDLLIFFAFLSGADRLIALTGGASGLKKLNLEDKSDLAKWVYIPLTVACMLMSLLTTLVANVDGEIYFLRGLDGIAFDQMTDLGRLWSLVLAAVLLVCVVERGQGHGLTISGVGKALLTHGFFLSIGIAVASLLLFWLTSIQANVRAEMVDFLRGDSSVMAKNAGIAVFAGSFAVVRMLCVLIILTVALRASFRRGA